MKSVFGFLLLIFFTISVSAQCEPTFGIDNQVACEEFIWMDGNTYNSSNNTATDTLINSAGCDSIITLNLTVNTTLTSTTDITICDTELPYTWNGLTFTATETQTATLISAVTGCDSLATLTLTVDPTLTSTTDITICDTELPYTWNGLTFTATDSQTATLTSIVTGCDSLATLNLTVNPTLTSTTDITICDTELPYTWNGLTFTTTESQTTTIISAVTGCDSTVTLNLTVNPTLTSTTDITICDSELPFDWNDLTFTIAGSQTTTLASEVTGCDSLATLNLTVDNSPISNAGPDQIINCIDNVSGVNIGSPSQSGVVYQWSPSIGLESISAPDPNANPLQTTHYTLTVTNIFGCSSTDDVTVEVSNDYPIANAGLDGIITCNENISGIQIGSPPSDGLNYEWQPSLGLSQPNESITIAFPSTSTWYQLQVTNPTNGCATNDSVFVEIDNDLPNFSAGFDQNTCVGTFIVLEGSGASTYSWDNGIQNGIPFLPNNSQYYTLTGTGGNGCIDTDSVYVSINPAPVVNAGTDTTICSGTSIILSGEGAAAYDWSSGVINGIAFTPQNSITYILTGYSEFGCSTTDQINITLIDSPEINLDSELSLCQGDSVDLFISENYSVNWSGQYTSNESSISFSPNESGFLYLYCENELNCSSIDSTFIIVNAIPYPIIDGPDFACENSQWQNYQSNPTLNQTEWTIENGEINWAFATNDVFVQWDSGIGEPIIGNISITETISETNCSNSYSKTVTLNGVAPESATINQLFEGSSTLYTQNDYPIMNWGYESVDTHIPVYVDENNQYCEFENFDPSNYNYWVEIGSDFSCLTKSYFNLPENVLLVNNEGLGHSYVYPNPAQDKIRVKSNHNSNCQYEIINLNGVVSGKGIVQKENPTVAIDNLEKGIYYINLIQNNGQQTTLKFIKI